MANYDPLKLTLDDRPRAILAAIDRLDAQPREYAELNARRRLIPRLLFGGALLVGVLDLFLGYSAHFLCFSSVLLGIAGIWAATALGRARPKANFSPRLKVARTVIETLRDDLHPDRGFFGTIDLLGADRPEKLAREAPNALGRIVAVYRDEWLSLKTKLYDGNSLRISAIEHSKVRKGYMKRGSSGKMKWKSPMDKGHEQQFKLRLAVNPERYNVLDSLPDLQAGRYTIEDVDTQGGIVSLSASAAGGEVSAEELLLLMRRAYSLLQRKDAA